MTDVELLTEVRALRSELRKLRSSTLVARLTEAERQLIARHVLDGLDERFAADRQTAAEQPPRRAPHTKRRYLRG